MTRPELEAERAILLAKLKARERAGGGYRANMEAIRGRLAAIELELENLGDG